jgi:hypothetical protein
MSGNTGQNMENRWNERIEALFNEASHLADTAREHHNEDAFYTCDVIFGVLAGLRGSIKAYRRISDQDLTTTSSALTDTFQLVDSLLGKVKVLLGEAQAS